MPTTFASDRMCREAACLSIKTNTAELGVAGSDLIPVTGKEALTLAGFSALADVSLSPEWLANIANPKTQILAFPHFLRSAFRLSCWRPVTTNAANYLLKQVGHGDMENAARFPHLQTPGYDYELGSKKGLD